MAEESHEIEGVFKDEQQPLPSEEDPERNCTVCQEAQWKYKCPECSARTCSLACSKSHKDSTGCNGKRKRTEFVPVAAFGDRELISDYRFLEEAAALRDSCARDTQLMVKSQKLQQLRQLQTSARIRNMTWHALPAASVRRQENTSAYDNSKKRLFWRVEWHLQAANMVVTNEQLDEQTKLSDAVQRHMKLQAGQASMQTLLQPYVDAGIDNLGLLLRDELRPANDPAWHRLRPNHTLRLALAQKEVVEFPVIVVALPEELPGFNILGSSHEPKQPPAAGAAASATRDNTLGSNDRKQPPPATAARDTTLGSNDTKMSPPQLPATAARDNVLGTCDTKQPPAAAAGAAAAIDNTLGNSSDTKQPTAAAAAAARVIIQGNGSDTMQPPAATASVAGAVETKGDHQKGQTPQHVDAAAYSVLLST